MFWNRKPVVETPKPPKTLTKEEQLGPKPADIPAPEQVMFEVILRHSLPSIRVVAHEHNFGERRENGHSYEYTHFVVYGDTTWTEYERYLGLGKFGEEKHRWEWKKHRPSKTVYSIRTTDVVMVAAAENVKPSETERYAISDRVQEAAKPTPFPTIDEFNTGARVVRDVYPD